VKITSENKNQKPRRKRLWISDLKSLAPNKKVLQNPKIRFVLTTERVKDYREKFRFRKKSEKFVRD